MAFEPPTETATVDLGGRCIGNSYILVRPIGQGGTGTVWRAMDSRNGELVAIKLLHGDVLRQPTLVTRFVQERAILLMLRHEHIVRVRDMLAVGDSLGLVMDLVSGGSLRDQLRERGTFPPAEAARLLAGVAAALAEAHGLGVVHRDLKPDNVLVQRTAAGLDARLTDFGIARMLDAPGLTTTDALVGTPHYLAPEIINGAQPSPALDIYALGVLLYELIVGHAPYADASSVSVLRRHLEDTPHRYPGIPDPVWSVIEACVDKEPLRRPVAIELTTTLRSLARAMAGVPALAPAPSPAAAPAPAAAAPTEVAATALLANPPPPRRVRAGRRRSNKAGTWRRARLCGIVAGCALVVSVAVPGIGPWHLFQPGRPHAGAAVPAAPPDPRLRPPGPSGVAASAATGTGSGGGPRPESAGLPGTGRPPPGQAPMSGPWHCADGYQWDPGHPMLAKPCYATGSGIRLLGYAKASPGVQADVSLVLQDAGSGRTVAGPYTCPGLMFTDFAPEHTCGPFATTARHGHRYRVVESWRYTGRDYLPGGSAEGPAFAW